MQHITLLQAASSSSSEAIGAVLLLGLVGYIIYLIRKQNDFLGNYDKSYFNLVRLFTGLKILSILYGILGVLIMFFAFGKIADMLSFTSKFRGERDENAATIIFLFFLCAVFLQSYIGYAIGEWGIQYVKNKSDISVAPISPNPDATVNTSVATVKIEANIPENSLQQQRIDKLKEVKSLLDARIITQGEFEHQKDIILNG